MKKKLGASIAAVALASSLFSTTSFAKENNGNAYGKIDLVGLGDSITLGSGLADPASEAFPYVIGKVMGLEVRDLGISGLTSGELLNRIKTDKNFRQSIKHANYITLDIGSNDFIIPLLPYQSEILRAASTGNEEKITQLIQPLVGSTLLTFTNNLNQIIKEISALTDAQIAVYNIYNPFQPDPTHLESFQSLSTMHFVSDPLISQVNQAIAMVALPTQYTNIKLVNAHSAFEGHPKYIIQGDIHPTELGQKILADLGEEALFGSK
ncbi:GDSL-type esterase/lipase family protein [Neobacillus cucumis]|nr:GDSL-type esterase/lipase family protein [Neobacillus cucumis]